MEEIDTLNRQLRRIEQELNRRAAQTPAVSQLRSIPGVGIRTAEAMAAFVDDPQRFPSAKAVGRYFGRSHARTSRVTPIGWDTLLGKARRSSAD